jgi:hypothetical protein
MPGLAFSDAARAAVATLLAGALIPAYGAALYSQDPVVPNTDAGSFSFPGQQLADYFSLDGDAKISTVIWYGSNICCGFGPTREFTLRVLAQEGNAPAAPPLIEVAVTASTTNTGGIVEIDNSTLYRFTVDLTVPWVLQGATGYFLSIVDAGYDQTDIFRRDVFRWANAAVSMTDSVWQGSAQTGVWEQLLDPGAIRSQVAYALDGCYTFPGGGQTGGCFPGPGPFPAGAPGTLALLAASVVAAGVLRFRPKASV